nr:TniQ family protein [Hydrogenovibrio crunogenus]
MKPSQLSTLIFEDTDTWKGDIDVFLNPKKITTLNKNTGIDENKIQSQTFYASCSYFYNQTEKTPQVKWVMPLGVRTRKKSFGLQYCPCCLSEDGNQPYFRKSWRLGFMTCCPFHSVQMHDRCPKCHNPIDIKRLQKHKGEILYHPEDIAYCSKCGFDLRKTQYIDVSSEEYGINRVNFIQSTTGYGKAGNLDFCYSNLYFEGIRRLLSFVVCSSNGKRLFVHLKRELQLQQMHHREALGHNIEPERLGINLRRTGFIMIYHLLQDWPETFVNSCKITDTSSHMIKTPYLEFPFWVSDTFFFNIHEHRFLTCDTEKKNIINYFQTRLKKKINLNQAVRLVKNLRETN